MSTPINTPLSSIAMAPCNRKLDRDSYTPKAPTKRSCGNHIRPTRRRPTLHNIIIINISWISYKIATFFSFNGFNVGLGILTSLVQFRPNTGIIKLKVLAWSLRQDCEPQGLSACLPNSLDLDPLPIDFVSVKRLRVRG